MKILGISCYYHDAAAVLLDDGRVVAGVEEERFSRKKHDNGFPKHAITFCLTRAGITAKDLDAVVFYEKPFRKFHRLLVSDLSNFPRSSRAFVEAMRTWLPQKLWIKQEIASFLGIDAGKIFFNEHHLSHAASCFYPSGFEKAAILTVDGVGEWPTALYGVGVGNRITILKELLYPHSVGLLYSAFTAFLGFEVNEGEWKVMGLAPYGKPRYADKVRKVVRLYPDGSIALDLSYFAFPYSSNTTYSDAFVSLFGDPIPPAESHTITKRAADIAASIQAVTDEILLAMTKHLHKVTQMDNLCYAGGVALNSVSNYKMLARGGFRNIFIQPAAGDSGGALGAALSLYHQVLGKKRRYRMTHAYWGEAHTDADIEAFLRREKIRYRKLSDAQLIDFAVDALTRGKVIGWMQGKFEWGPRALGDRSILADARNPKMKDIINAKVKFREAFRPFAPSLIGERAGDVLELPENYRDHQPLRYMLYVTRVRPEWRKRVPAITHADNSTRPQLVYKKENPRYHTLLTAFYRKTGVPLLLNTSFNLRGEPIVASPEDAYRTYMRSGIDVLIMGNIVCRKEEGVHAAA